MAAASGLGAEECSRSDLMLPGTYFARETGVKRHYSGSLLIGEELLVRTTNSIKEYVGPTMVEGVLVECTSAHLSITQFGEKQERDANFYYLIDEDRVSLFSYEIGEDNLP